MAFEANRAYEDVNRGFGRFKSPIKLKHAFLPLAFVLFCIYRNQKIADLSIIEAIFGLLTVALCFIPLFIWGSKEEREAPAFQCFCLIFFPYYAYPILTCKPAYMQFPETTRIIADATVLIFLAVTILSYYGVRSAAYAGVGIEFLGNRRMYPNTELTIFTLFHLVWVFYVVAPAFGLVNLNLGGARNIVGAIATGCGLVSVWTLARKLGRRELRGFHSVYFVATTAATILISFVSGSLAYGFTIIIMGVAGYTLGLQRIPWVLIMLVLSVVSFLNIGKGAMRSAYWRHGFATADARQLVEIYELWCSASLRVLVNNEYHSVTNRGIMERMNLIHMQALVVEKTPKEVPYFYGKTYAHVPQVLIPRLLWPNKPHGHVSTELLGLSYKVTNRSQARTTTIGLGLLGEAWANFGWLGIVGLAILMGVLMRFVANAFIRVHESSLHSVLSVLWVGWSFQIEGALSSWLSSLLQSVVVVLLVLYPLTYSTAQEKGHRPQESFT